MRFIAKIITAVILLNVAICAQQPSWDLSYESVLERNNVAKTEWIWPWLKRYKSPAADWIAGWDGKSIVSSILIEFPAFHAAEHTTIWLIRTGDEAFYWDEVEGRKSRRNEEPITPQIYDDIYKQATAWQQLPPKSANELPKDALPGYIGFLSHHGPDGSRQVLLTLDDFLICLDKSCMPGKGLKSGRLMAALEPILIPEAEKNYRHKPESEIALMTPQQRIDEQIREHDHMLDHTDKQGDLIRRYRLRDGLNGSAHLIKLIDGYDPKRQRDDRFFNAMMMANEIDENIVRLRSSAEGRHLIEAVERLVARRRAAGEEESQVEATLRYMKGVNFTDESVRDTLWMKYRIKISDAELAEFSDYLVRHHPTYPSWSTRTLTKDHSSVNDAGSPAQLVIMKSPKRYHQAYLAFKRLIVR